MMRKVSAWPVDDLGPTAVHFFELPFGAAVEHRGGTRAEAFTEIAERITANTAARTSGHSEDRSGMVLEQSTMEE